MVSSNTNKRDRRRFSAFTVNIVFLLFSIVGLALIPKLTIKLNPKLISNSLTVNYTWPNAVSGVLEHEVTAKLEGAFSTLQGIEHLISGSSNGYGYIKLEAKKHTNIQTLRFEVLSIIKDVWQNLPEGVTYPEIHTGSEGNEHRQLLLSYVLKGNSETSTLQQYAENNLRTKFISFKGISSVEVYGASPYEWQLIYDKDILNKYGIKPNHLFEALQMAKEAKGAGQGFLNNAGGNSIIVPVIVANPGLDRNDPDWKNIPVKNLQGRIIYLGDLVKLHIVQQQPQSYFRINGLNTVFINIYSEETANQISVADKLSLIEQQISTSLPAGFSLEKMFNSTDYLRKELSKTTRRTLAALVILLVFILIITRSSRYLFVVFLCLSANLAVACIFYYFLHIEIHLVSIAGITVSLSIIIDNFIMMTNYLVQQRSMRGFTAILGSTLTTLGALVVIFFLNENERAYLIDFALVVIINLAVSLAVSLFFIPALITRLKLTNQSGKVYRKRKRLVSKFNYLYSEYIVKAHRWRWIMVILAIIAFGLPIFILPDSIKGDSLTANIYNRSLGSYFYKDNLKPFIDKWTGGSLRLFAQNSLNKFAGFQEATETVLFINISLPKGTNTLQMNELCMNLERYLAGFDGIQQYQTSINGPQYANITVYFTPKAQHSSIPFHVKAKMIEKAVEFNGADFYIYMKNDGFSNALQESWRGSRLELSGYNYRSLSNLAQTTVDSMIKNPRIQNIAIFSGEPGGRTPVTEEQINLEIDKSMFSANNTAYHQLYQVLLNRTVTPQLSGMIKQNGDYIPVRLVESQSQKMDLWQFMHTPFIVDSLMVKLANTAKISNVTTDGSIYKKDQSYIVTLAYDFVGPEELSQRVLKREVLKLNNKLPLGYKAAIHNYNYSGLFGNNPVNYWVIGLVILIIWGICAIIFESLIQPFAVICSIPLSFIGVFLTFYLFDVAFDQGGYAAFILLSGIVVNMSIYIFNDINHLRRNTNLNPMAIYMKAFNIKIVPILLSTIATILGLFPFILFDKGTVFWYNLAVGTVGGLIFSIPMLIIYLPLMVKITRNNGDIWPISKLNNTINSKTK